MTTTHASAGLHHVVDGLLHEAQPEDPSVEVEVAARRARDGGDVVQAGS
jgi:hypothetical protein